MPLPNVNIVLETGAGIEGANSYVSVAMAATYLAANAFAGDWFELDDMDKARNLIRASQIVDGLVIWNGYKKSREQGLAWPRSAAADPEARRDSFRDPLSSGFEDTAGFLPDDEVPEVIRQVVCEIANSLLEANPATDSDARGVRSLNLGKEALKVELQAGSESQTGLSRYVEGLLLPFGRLKAGQGGGVFNVIR